MSAQLLEHWAGYDLGGEPFINALKVRERRIYLKANRGNLTRSHIERMVDDLDNRSIYYETVEALAEHCHVHNDETAVVCFHDKVTGKWIAPNGEVCTDNNNTGSMEARYGRNPEEDSSEQEADSSPEGDSAGGNEKQSGKAGPRKGSQATRKRSTGKGTARQGNRGTR